MEAGLLMADEAQVIYEYVNGSTISFKTNDLKITYHRWGMKISRRPNGIMHVDDPGIEYRIFTFTAVITGAVMKTLNDVQMAAITYSGAYPRITKIRFDGGGSNEITNIEVAIPDGGLTVSDLGNGEWGIQCTMEEKTD